MDFFQLTEAQRRDFDADGFLIIPQAIDAETVTRLTEAGDRLMASFIADPESVYLQRPRRGRAGRSLRSARL